MDFYICFNSDITTLSTVNETEIIQHIHIFIEVVVEQEYLRPHGFVQSYVGMIYDHTMCAKIFRNPPVSNSSSWTVLVAIGRS